jgi:hypothetical protein
MSGAGGICRQAAKLVEGDRADTHGDALVVHAGIALSWNAYLAGRLASAFELSPKDVALMMALVKIERTKHGQHNPDNYVDLAGYAGIAGEIAAALPEGEVR